MALKATIYKAELAISDIDRGYYANHQLTLAQHPSETIARLMLRIAVFALHANPQLAFTKGICVDDEPDLWQKDDTGAIDHWIELGEPDLKRLKRAASKARQVHLYCYGGRAADNWWQQNKNKCQELRNLYIASIQPDVLEELAGLCQRSMQLSATIQEHSFWLENVEVPLAHWQMR